VRAWIHGLGIDTFVGTSGRVFPTEMKAAPLLRAWLHRLREAACVFHMRHRWLGWRAARCVRDAGRRTPGWMRRRRVLALGGASWARLGSDGAWAPLLAARGVDVAPLRRPTAASTPTGAPHFSEPHAGAPLTTVGLASRTDRPARSARASSWSPPRHRGQPGVRLSAPIRDRIARDGQATVWLDLLPDHDPQRVLTR
jgi:predicted flavoprotein YhiN